MDDGGIQKLAAQLVLEKHGARVPPGFVEEFAEMMVLEIQPVLLKHTLDLLDEAPDSVNDEFERLSEEGEGKPLNTFLLNKLPGYRDLLEAVLEAYASNFREKL